MKGNGIGVVLAGLLFSLVAANAAPSWGIGGFDAAQSLSVEAFLSAAGSGPAPRSPLPFAILEKPELQSLEWVAFDGGKFMMGTEDKGDSKPVHEVVLKPFEMSKTAVTVEQYAQCVSAGRCAAPRTGDRCNWGQAGRERHPVNCVDWLQANQYAKFQGARLPSESEWEYAARSGGRNQKYPWGSGDADCAKAVMREKGGAPGCGAGGTMPVCSKPAGNTAQGLCDMAGNVSQWVQDKHRFSYVEAPKDGGAFESAGSFRVIRGGSFLSDEAGRLRADARSFDFPDEGGYDYIGFRLARWSR